VYATVTTGALWAATALAPTPPASSPNESGDAYRTEVEPQSESDRLEGQRRMDARNPGFGTSIDTQASDLSGDEGVAGLVARAPGTSVRSIGGLGQFAAVSIRGSAPQQVPIFLDGVPLGDSLAGQVDLSTLPVDGLGRIDIYRGHVPVEYGAAAVGGAIDLVGLDPGSEPRARFVGGVGSYGARRSRGSVQAPVGARVTLGALAAYDGATGDYPYYDDGGTPIVGGDDQTTRRANNDYDRVLAQARATYRQGDTTVRAGQLVTYKRQGVPGRLGMTSTRARASQLTARTTARIDRHAFGDARGRLSWVSGLGVGQRRLSDPGSEIGLAIDDEQATDIDVYLSPRLRLGLWRGAWLSVVADQRTEWVDVREQAPTLGTSGDARRARLWFGAGAQFEQFAFDDRWLIAPSVRVDGIASRFAVAADQGEQDDTGRNDAQVGVSPRLATRIRLGERLSLRATVGRAFRPPNLTELFGDRGYVVGNEGLRPERSTSVDGGFVLDHSGDFGDVYGQAAAFSVWAEDLIQWVAAGPVTRPVNVDGARLWGTEVSAVVEPRRRYLRVRADYTWLHTAARVDDPAQDGRPLPGRPAHELFATASAGWPTHIRGLPFEPRVQYTVDVIAGTFLDPSGRLALPPRALQALGLELSLARRISLHAVVRNLLDVRTAAATLPVAGARATPMPISDFLGFPLPGRSLWVQLRVDVPLLGARRRHA
jgi:iron complex outermembrane receptor protein